MNIKKYNIFKIKSIFLLIITITLVSVFIDDVISKIILVFILSISISISSYLITNDWKSPFFIIPVLSILYYTVFPLYFYLGGDRIYGVDNSDVNNALNATVLFYIGMSLSFLTNKITFSNHGIINVKNYAFYDFYRSSAYIILILFLILYSYSYIQLRSVVGMSKEDRMLTNAISFSVFFGGVYLYYSYLLIDDFYKNNSPLKIMSIVLPIGLVGAIVLGERDQIIFPVIYSFLIYGYFYKIKFKNILLFGFVIIFSLFLMGVYRGYQQHDELRQLSSIVDILQENEFISSGRNIAYLINENPDYLYGLTFLGDIGHSFFITYFPTGSQWFSNNYISNKGLSIIAESYINFGYVGCFVIGYLYITIVNYFYGLSFRNNILTILYLVIIMASLYSLRSDFAAIPSGVVKKIIIPLLCIVILNVFLGKLKIKKHSF
ncbi:oligosaccharide repeat unit polymerase [Photobacterium phosphoreum]|uniref:O-antigen polymerase n=1 Tax=Photobacterium phosphoreum TaxID=659 RepID=UPI0007F8B9E1|nr:O-antigen polymerase [Photobacterium phosphoreum]OBU38454.1 hypothetical protein AYY25_16980 [Photobacterium phosphoreum]PSU75268.1 oligosaccharide repeat unit polymerase [Photobacterium phosphoreum]